MLVGRKLRSSGSESTSENMSSSDSSSVNSLLGLGLLSTCFELGPARSCPSTAALELLDESDRGLLSVTLGVLVGLGAAAGSLDDGPRGRPGGRLIFGTTG